MLGWIIISTFVAVLNGQPIPDNPMVEHVQCDDWLPGKACKIVAPYMVKIASSHSPDEIVYNICYAVGGIKSYVETLFNSHVKPWFLANEGELRRHPWVAVIEIVKDFGGISVFTVVGVIEGIFVGLDKGGVGNYYTTYKLMKDALIRILRPVIEMVEELVDYINDHHGCIGFLQQKTCIYLQHSFQKHVLNPLFKWLHSLA